MPLVLTRKFQEEIVLKIAGVEARIMILDSDGNRHRVLIDAPRDVLVLRGELLRRDAGGGK